MQDFFTLLKSKNDIMSTAYSLGFKGHRSGRCFQGECPKHYSKGGTCLTIWPGIQGWKCFHCNKSGDIIGLVMLYKGCDIKTAVEFLAKRADIPLRGGKELSPEETQKRQQEIEEKKLVEDMLTEAQKWFHDQLHYYPDILNHLRDHYGFSDDIINEFQIGFAPVSKKSDGTSELADYLNSIPEFRGKIALTSLFSFKEPQGQLYDYFKGRIVFPYWIGGKVVYMNARATTLTPVDSYECYVDNEKKPKLDAHGKPEFIKYKKLRVYDPDDEKRKHFSKFIQNDAFMGEDSVRGAEEIIITEGAPDWVSAVDHGFNAISPVTVNFREKDFEKLERVTQGAKAIFIINDNEENRAGYEGAIKTGKYLTGKGKNVFLVELPRPAGVSKVDLNEYLKDHPADDLRGLMKNAKSILQILIEHLPEDFIKALPTFKDEIAPLMTCLEGGILQHYTTMVHKRTKASAKAISMEIDAAREVKKLNELKKEEKQLDPEIAKGALKLAADPLLFKKRLDMINAAGVVGERKIIAMCFCAFDSRLLSRTHNNPNTLALKNAGHYGSGKSYTLTTCLLIYPEECYYLITNGSAKSLYYLKGGLKNKALIVTEGFQFQDNNAGDSELVYVTRSLLSEGEIRYCSVEKDDEGKLVTKDRYLEGPTSFVTTTIMDKLEEQLEDRLFTIHPDEGVQQSKDIVAMTASQKDGTFQGLDSKVIEIWKEFHRLLKPVQVIVPFAKKISDSITSNQTIPISTRRAFNRVLIVIQAVTCVYQHQRKKDSSGRIISDIADYWIALQIVTESFRENLGQQDKKTEDRIEYIIEKGLVLPKELAETFAVSSSSITQWTTRKIKDGVLTWCDGSGSEYVDEGLLKKAKHSGKAHLKVSEEYDIKKVMGLPTPFDLTNDPDWNHGGKLLIMFDLELDKRSSGIGVFSGVYPVFSEDINTSKTIEYNNIINEYVNENKGVKVFIENQESEENIYKDDPEDGNDDGEDDGNDNIILSGKKVLDFSDALDEVLNKGKGEDKSITPHLCRKGCKHYDGVQDVNDGLFKEFCDANKGSRIEEGKSCKFYEVKETKLKEGILGF